MRGALDRFAGDGRPLVTDVAVALFLLAYTVMEIVTGDADPDARVLHLAGATLMTLPLALRRIAPWVPAVAFVPAMILDSVLVVPVNSFGQFVAAMLVAYSLAAHATRRAGLLGGAAFAVAIGVFLVRDPLTTNLLDASSTVIVLVVWVGIGLFVRRRRREGDLQARRAAVEERTRIAHELHDLVGHAVSLMTVQAGVARVALDAADGVRAREALGAVETAGRQAMDELRRVLGILQPTGPDPDALGPQPGIDAIEALVGQHRAAGLPVRLDLEGEPRPIPAGVALAVYRIVQESLTNVRKHAGAPETVVTLRYGPDRLDVEVRDHGPGARSSRRAGHGIAGMRERAALYGGHVDIGEVPGDGFRVAAAVPTSEAAR